MNEITHTQRKAEREKEREKGNVCLKDFNFPLADFVASLS